ncbi:hypothetical protein Purlil1_12540 [Purpureocillium lilacinum]|uniref:Uncharacterized protein n=1 Tax=Purpureocillium lilacinum TaxID=33203 RepID=A0ABR0BGN9_PURLI|nr:hypothetical protein Purlil1_12540 [Purpureocillium lilacinum]
MWVQHDVAKQASVLITLDCATELNMDCLRSTAEASFERYSHVFENTENGFHHLVEIKMRTDGDAQVKEVENLHDIPQLWSARQKMKERMAGACLKLVCLFSNVPHSENIGLPKENFRHLLEHFHIDPCVLHLLQFNCYGVHWFSHDDNGTTFYIGTVLYVLIWSFQPATGSPRAVIILRPHERKSRYNTFLEFRNVLLFNKNRAFGPLGLAFVALVHLTNCADSMIYEDLNSIRVLESKTGRGLWAAGDREQNSYDLTELSKEIGKLMVLLANQRRHLDIASSLLSLVDDDYSWTGQESPNGPARRCSASMGAILSALAPLKRRIEASRAYVQYLDTRLSSQSSVVFALMTSEDACIAKEIAEASRDIARLTGKDSYSMKTVAILTMAFLPATFFAALFSMPLLDWREPVVIQEKFWVYIAFTISSTILVFVGWPEHLTRWDVSFVSDRSAARRYSPILFLLYTEPIYRLGNSLQTTADRASRYVSELVTWGAANGISYDLAKTEAMQFCRTKPNVSPPIFHEGERRSEWPQGSFAAASPIIRFLKICQSCEALEQG